MAGEAHRTTVGDYVTLVRGTTYKGQLVGEPGPALLGLGSIEPGGGFRIGNYKTYGGDCPDELMLVPGDIYASLKGATKDGKMIGSVARVPLSVHSGRLTQDTVKLVFRNPCSEDQDYLYWILRTPQYREYCAGHATGSAVVALSRRDFLSYPVPPPTTPRRKVVTLLDTIEKRIELNRQLNETLESLARALFKSWFVNFEPVRAKAEGRTDGLPHLVAKLFPDALENSEIGEIPRGWSIATVGDLASIVGGTTPSTANPLYWDDGQHPWVTPKDLSALSTPVLLSTERSVTDAGLAQIGSGLLPQGTILLSSRAPIGYLAVAEISVAINQGFIGMIPHSGISNLFLLYWARAAHDVIVSRANGSTFLEISKANFRPIPLVSPPQHVMHAFDCRARQLYERVVANERHSRTLAEARDALLPRLLSGEFRTKDADLDVAMA